MKRFFMILMLICTMFAVPAYADTTEPAIILADEPVSAANNVRYTTTSVNIRKEPSTEAEIVYTAERNTQVSKIRDIDDKWTGILWYDENHNGVMYYVASQYLSEEEVTTPPVNDNDRYWLAHAINGEMQGASWEDHLYTGSVILNRVKSKHYPNSIESVITDRRWGIQYACYWDGNFQKTPSATAWKAADYLLTNGSVFPDNVLFQAEFRQGNGTYVHTKAAYYCIW